MPKILSIFGILWIFARSFFWKILWISSLQHIKLLGPVIIIFTKKNIYYFYPKINPPKTPDLVFISYVEKKVFFFEIFQLFICFKCYFWVFENYILRMWWWWGALVSAPPKRGDFFLSGGDFSLKSKIANITTSRQLRIKMRHHK